MKIFAEKNKKTDGVELLLSYQELKELADALEKFEDEVKRFKADNKEKKDLGFTHMHFQDYNKTCADKKTDIVFYVDLNQD